jgi:hypothetical protein
MEIASPKLRQLYAHWVSRTHAPFPRQSEFHPSDLRFILGGLSLIEVHREPLRFLYQLHGTEMARWVGFDLTGKFIGQCPNESWAALAARHLREVAISGEPSIAWHFDEIVGNQYWNLEALVLPISRDGSNLDMMISAVDPNRRGTRALQSPPPTRPRRPNLGLYPEIWVGAHHRRSNVVSADSSRH